MTIKRVDPHASADRWPTPLEMLDLMDAIDQQKKEVTLSGKVFTIRYRDNKYLVQPKEGYVPMGWFDDNSFVEYRG